MNADLIMIVDDDEDDRFFFKKASHKIGLLCLDADSGESALEILQNAVTLPEYIFVDLNMPCMTGFEFIKKVKQNNIFKSISVIVYSTSNSADDIRVAEESGAGYYLPKPADMSALPENILMAIEEVKKKTRT